MTPDVYANLTILNVTPVDLTAGNGGDNAGFFHEYQMCAWFGAPDASAPSPVAPARGQATYLLQFLRGVGDEDDAANMQINAGTENIGAENVVWLQARSADNSAHYIQAVVQHGNAHGGPYVIAFTPSGAWPSSISGVGQLQWAGPGNTITTGTPCTDQTLAVIDLAALFPATVAAAYAQTISAGQLSVTDAEVIWYGVMKFLGRPA